MWLRPDARGFGICGGIQNPAKEAEIIAQHGGLISLKLEDIRKFKEQK